MNSLVKWKIALKNIFRNRRRTTLNVLMIVGGFTAIVIFKGFSMYMLGAMENVIVNTQFGHLQIGKPSFWNREAGVKPPEMALEKLAEKIENVKNNSNVEYVAPRNSFFSLITTQEVTTSGQGWGIDPKTEVKFMESLRMVEGEKFSFENDYEILLGSGLQNQLKAKMGDTLTLVGQTWDGSANAIDPVLKGVFQTGLAEVDNSTFIISFKASQKLLDTENAEKLLVILKDGNQLQSTTEQLQAKLGNEVQVKPWQQLAKLYVQVVEFYNVQNGMVQIILAVLIFLAIVNTVGMSIFERTGEIGTLRALGDTEKDILIQFIQEGILLSCISCLIAIPISFLIAQGISAGQFPIDMPGASMPIMIKITIKGVSFAHAFIVVSLTTMLASIFPAYKASKIDIVAALRKNI